MSEGRRSLVKFGALVLFLAGAIWFFRFTPTGRDVTPGAVLDWVRGFPDFPQRLVYVLVYVLGTVLLLPGTVLSFAGAILFGAYEGTLWTWIGATLGATLAFLLARFLGRDSVDRLLGGRLQALDRRLSRDGFSALLVLRLVPLFPFNGLNFGCGLTGIRLRDYCAATVLGILPGTFVYQFLFARFGRKILEEGFAWSDLLDPQLGLALGLFVAFLVVGKLAAGRMKKPESPPAESPAGD